MLQRHHHNHIRATETTTEEIEIMPLQENDELRHLTVQGEVDGVTDASSNDATAVASGDAASAPATSTYQNILTRSPSDIRGSFEDIKSLIHQHTGTHEMIFCRGLCCGDD